MLRQWPADALLVTPVFILALHLHLFSPIVPFVAAAASPFGTQFASDPDVALTIGAILDPDLENDPKKPCCDDLSDFDIFARLAHEAGIFNTLNLNQIDGGITLIAPSDIAMGATANDTADIFRLAHPKTEKEIYKSIKKFIALFKNPQQVLRDIMLFHIMNGTIALSEIIQFSNFSSDTYLDDQVVISSGISLLPESQGWPLMDEFLPPNFIIGPDEQINARNGIIIAVDRMLFPNMAQFTLKEDTQLTPIPSSIPTAISSPFIILSPSQTASPSLQLPSSPPSNQPPECFPASARVTLHNGIDIPLHQLVAGLVVRATEQISSPVYLFTHKQTAGRRWFIRLVSEANHTVLLSHGHYIYANGRLTPASRVLPGDTLRTLDGPTPVKSTHWVQQEGLVAPHTMHGDIVVNRVVASTYTTAIHPVIAHALLWPLRALVHAGIATEPLGTWFYSTPCYISKFLLVSPLFWSHW